MEEWCPVCRHELTRQGDEYYCESCHNRFRQQILCPDCGKPLEVLTACGAVDYFCPHGDGLISKKRVARGFIAL